MAIQTFLTYSCKASQGVSTLTAFGELLNMLYAEETGHWVFLRHTAGITKTIIQINLMTIKMLHHLFLFLVFVLSFSKAQAQNLFPDKCTGTWEGMMQIYYQGTLRDSVKVRFTVAPQSENAWKWQTEYLSEKMPLTKNYTLKLKDATQNLYITDEGNGIELHEYLFGNKLYSVFEVEGILLTSSYELRGEELIFEVTSGKKIPEATTQEVSNFSTLSLQRVILKKVK